ncbi:hypothetical protein HK104_009845 [Borealophlyctis nickersoniae]|nr:hypothetical protein HK104_009845 [Borealophlyctis nickersoniae]
MYRHGVGSFQDMSSLPKQVREALEKIAILDHGTVKVQHSRRCWKKARNKDFAHTSASNQSKQVSKDGTRKWLLNFGGKADVETVFIPEAKAGPEGDTGTLTSTAKSFCHTGTQKLLRNLTASEIVSQLIHVFHDVGEFPLRKSKPRKITNIVFMGQGEPLLNPRAVFSAISTITSPDAFGLAPWRITLSTSGVAPMMGRISKELKCSLAVSLHAVNDATRDVLVPLNKQYPIKDVLQGCRDYLHHMPQETRHRRITFEYVMLDGVNDFPADARELARLIGEWKLPAHVNLIPWNPWEGSNYTTSPPEAIRSFASVLINKDIPCTVRMPRGQDIMAAWYVGISAIFLLGNTPQMLIELKNFYSGQLKTSDEAKRSRLSTVGTYGFTAGNVQVRGPILFINGHVFNWDVPQFGLGSDEVVGDLNREPTEESLHEVSPFVGWTTDMFKMLEVVTPPPEILVVGTGAQMAMFPQTLRNYIHSLGIQIEVQPSRHAASTFNVLLQEGRRPAAALLPVVPTSARTGEPLVKLLRQLPPELRDEY